MNVKILNNKLFVYSFFLIISFLIRYYLFEGRESWFDEWHSIYVANPNFNNAETLIAYYGDKGDTFLTEFYPPLYIFILKYFFQGGYKFGMRGLILSLYNFTYVLFKYLKYWEIKELGLKRSPKT